MCEFSLFNTKLTIFQLIMVRTSYIRWDDNDVCLVLVRFYSASSLKRKSAGKHVIPLRHTLYYPDSGSTSLCSFCLSERLLYNTKWAFPSYIKFDKNSHIQNIGFHWRLQIQCTFILTLKDRCDFIKKRNCLWLF
jgi:hypothetical protein